ncbi:S8 family serine peptidase [Bradyrhizobium japonicum]|uniref:S8 family serine peptidase n=1 Tax=Bradyrhizobium japonicum TaxID=375 RepID=UPI0027147177|nr:S8 family serine peptidase [Bradyrhizobium japonicum]WLB54268.1 S8 family serine peptidase [Bradyrhizobium japonicum]WLB63859.1 S8 family serine peptidase [Bradyrhizobium japonicum]
MAQITINGITIDPSAPHAERAALSLDHANAKDSDYIIVQTNQPLNAERREQLAKAGAEILEAVPGSAVICHFPAAGLDKVRKLPFVAWADLYPGIVKIAPALRNLDTQPGGVAAARALAARPAALDRTSVTVDVMLHRNVGVKAAAKKIAEAAHVQLDDVVPGTTKVRVTLKMRRLADVAALDEVRSVEKVFPRKLLNNIARGILRVPAATPSNGGEGAGEIIAIADTGFDKGSTTNTHPAFKGRVKKLYALGRPGRKDDPDGHGTHVAGSALGDGVSKSDGPIRGTAPGAKLVLQSVLDSGGNLGGLPDSLDALFGPPYKTDKARIHSNSWGSVGNFGVYDSQANELDTFVYAHRDMLICFAAGNEGSDKDGNGQVDPNSVTPPGTAKNCLTIGACENNRPNEAMTYGRAWPDDFPATPISSDRVANNPEGMVAFSSRGPTNDERIKPDVVAPGSFILSTRSRATKSKGWKLSQDPLYMFEGGTSMATPLVAGSVAVIRAFLRKSQGLKSPSAALLKALIINGARSLAGQYHPSEAGSVANNSQGFGRVDVQAVVGPHAANEELQFFDEKKKLDAGDREDRTVTIPAGSSRLKVTLVWTDPPGEGLQSDLDLVVVANKQERHGNMPAGSKDFDRRNNVEQVIFENLPPGEAVISVIAHSIAVAPQNYALVIRVS